MAITTLDGVIAGFQQPQPIVKTGIATAAVGGNRAYSLWYASGHPSSAPGPAPGTTGATLVNNTFGQVTGAIGRADGGTNNYLGRFSMTASTVGTAWLVDRLWHNSGLSATLTTGQTVNSVAWPARDRTGVINGSNVFVGVEWSTTGGAGTPTLTLSYTDSQGTAGRTATTTGVTTPPIGTVELFPFTAATPEGVRSIQTFTQSATRTSGNFHLVAFRQLAVVEITLANTGKAVDALTAGLPRLYNGTTLQLLWFPSATTATTFSGQYIETQG